MISVHNYVAPATVRRLNDTHDLSGALGGCSLLSTFLICTFMSVILSLAVLIIKVLALLDLIPSLLFGCNHRCDNVTVRTGVTTTLLAGLMNVGCCVRYLTCNRRTGISHDIAGHRVGP